MRSKALLALLGLLALAFFLVDNDSYGQRGGARVGGGVSRGGSVVGPYGGAGGGARTTGTVIGPTGRTTTGSAGSGSYTTGRGTTINAAGAGRTTTGPGGVTAGRGIGGVQVTTPGGQTATKVGTTGGVKGPGGNGAVGGKSISGTSGPLGSGVSASRGGVAVGPGGAVGGGTRVGTATGPGGRTVSGASHWSAATNPYTGYTGTSRGVAVGGVGHRTTYANTTALRAQGVYVRKSFVAYNSFSPTWYRAHPAAWRVPAWPAATFWRWTPYVTVATFCGYPATPVIYDYGTTLVYEDNRVYYNAEPIATADEYADQAIQIAAVGQAAKPSDKEEWTPLGVFGMIQGDEKDANNIFQLAINKDGVIRGNYYNVLTDTTTPVYGSVDKKTQRAAWTVGERKDTVYETGLGNLSQPETQMLVHFGKERTQQWTLIRLEQPPEEK
jgi:hypothetical protein